MQSDRRKEVAAKVRAALGARMDHSADASLADEIRRLSARIDALEKTAGAQSQPTRALNIHPSHQKLANLVDQFLCEKDKTCGFEPNAKSCDGCSMCSTRGF